MEKVKLLLVILFSCLLLASCASKEPENVAENQASTGDSEKNRASASSSDPADSSPLSGTFNQFTSEDLDGNAVTQEVFTRADLTVLNLWGTYCGPCIKEMPYFAELADSYPADEVQFIGIPTDVTDDDGIQAAQEIIDYTKADYLHILPNQELEEIYLNKVTAVPETLFIDKNGNIIKSVLGAKEKAAWKDLIDEVYDDLGKE